MNSDLGKASGNVYELMTFTDWFGLVLSVVLFLLLLGAYWYSYSPRRKSKLESHKFIVMNDYHLKNRGSDGKAR